MGGTFDPIHHGHLMAAEEARWQFDLDEVVFVPTGQPWMKSERRVSPPEDRYLMVVIATSSNPRFMVSRLEIERDGPTYTVDTLRAIAAERGDVDLFFITGADAMLEILQWKDPDDALALAHFIAATRPGTSVVRKRSSCFQNVGKVGSPAGMSAPNSHVHESWIGSAMERPRP